MKASLDTNVIIHLYRANLQEILFQRFGEGLYVYEQIRNVEMVNHGSDILDEFDKDVNEGRISIYTDEDLKKNGVFTLFQGRVRENRLLYSPKDLGEVYAISLAQTLGVYSLVTDDIKKGGPYMSLLQFVDNDIMPFTYVDVLLLNFMAGIIDERQVVSYFNRISSVSALEWSLQSHLAKFMKRFWNEPYQVNEKEWMKEFCEEHGIKAKERIGILIDFIKK